MRVLSIDFDYFLQLKGNFNCLWFPDGGTEQSNDLREFIWANCYASANEAGLPFEKCVTVDMEALNKVCSFLQTQKRRTVFYMAESHKWLWQLTSDLCAYRQQQATVVNIDFHHDTYVTEDKNVHCGNWLLHLIEGGVAKEAIWICRDESDEETAHEKLRTELSLDEALRGQYDLIYLCRSGWWVPPHLDSFFIDSFVNPLRNRRGLAFCEEEIQSSRYTDEFKKNVEELISAKALLVQHMKAEVEHEKG